MGACESSANNVTEYDHHHQMTNSGSVDSDHELAKAMKVIDGLNVEIETLGQEMAMLRKQVSQERQAKQVQAAQLAEAQRQLEELEAERTELNTRLNAMQANHVEEHREEETMEQHEHEHCFGQCQSPINIISIDSAANRNHTVHLEQDQFAESGLKFNYPEKVRECTIINNGHTVQVNIPGSAKCRVSIYGKEFELKQFHFHTPSEHTIDSKQYEMEMHLVHVNEVGEICVLGFIFTLGQRYQKPRLKLSKSRHHLVLAGHRANRRARDDRDEEEAEESDDLETDDEWEDEEQEKALQEKAARSGNDFLAQFWDQLPTSKTEREIPLNKPISFDYLFETSSRTVRKNVKTNEIEIEMDIFEYMGSLTTPPYTEGVQWLVSKTTHFINEPQLKSLRVCWNNHNNARPVQKYFGRQVSLRSRSSLRMVQ